MQIKPAHSDFAEKMVRHLMWELTEREGFTTQDLADAIGGSARTYENYKYDSMPTLAGFLAMIRVGKPADTVKRITAQCGGYFVVLPNRRGGELDTVARQTSEIMNQTADVIKACADSMRDGKVSIAERLRIVNEIDEAIEALIKTKLCMEHHGKADSSR